MFYVTNIHHEKNKARVERFEAFFEKPFCCSKFLDRRVIFEVLDVEIPGISDGLHSSLECTQRFVECTREGVQVRGDSLRVQE